jgi:hypothetical protein
MIGKPAMRETQGRRAMAGLAARRRCRYLRHNKRQVTMLSRFFRRLDGHRHLWSGISAPGERRIAGVLIAFFGR